MQISIVPAGNVAVVCRPILELLDASVDAWNCRVPEMPEDRGDNNFNHSPILSFAIVPERCSLSDFLVGLGDKYELASLRAALTLSDAALRHCSNFFLLRHFWINPRTKERFCAMRTLLGNTSAVSLRPMPESAILEAGTTVLVASKNMITKEPEAV